MVLVFDFDGTLHNTAHLYGCSFRAAYEKLVSEGAAPPRDCPDAEMARYIGMTADEMWKNFMPEYTPEERAYAGGIVGREMTAAVDRGDAELYPGIPEVLTYLKDEGHTLIILSNCKEAYMNSHRRLFGLDNWFSAYYCAETYGFIPKERIFDSIMKDFPGESFVVIGDRSSDFAVGTEHGIPNVGCSYGFGSPDELSACSAIAESPCEIPRAISEAAERHDA